jgi:hypothetical protein
MGDDVAERGRNLEDEYFHRKEKELIEKLRQRSERVAQVQALSEATGIPDQDILETLHELGYTPGTIALLHLVPLIQVGWADGSISSKERELILEAARLRGVTEGSPAYDELTDWLTTRPKAEFLDQVLSVIRRLLEADESNAGKGLLEDSIRVANASGGILGFGNKISDEERALIERIAKGLGKSDSMTES